MSSTADSLSRWWNEAEMRIVSGATRPEPGEPGWSTALQAAYRAEVHMDLERAQSLLDVARPQIVEPELQRVAELVELRLALRASRGDALAGLREQILSLIRRLPVTERATLGRAHHLDGVLLLRTSRLDECEDALMQAFAYLDEEPARSWLFDTLGQLLIGLGAWHEARFLLGQVIEHKQALGDALGQALTLGHLALMATRLGEPALALGYVERAQLTSVAQEPPMAVRLATLQVRALIACRNSAGLRQVLPTLEALVPQVAAAALRTEGALAASDAWLELGEPARANRWLELASTSAVLPEQRALVSYATLAAHGTTHDQVWFSELTSILEPLGEVTEVELRSLLLLASGANERGDGGGTRDWIDRACQRAAASNNHTWVHMVESGANLIDPTSSAERALKIHTGRSPAELSQTRRADATIVFADLVGFSARAANMPPEEVMDTARTVFELSSAVLVRHQLRPLAYLGDGLLAVAEGSDHRRRGLAFALEFTRRSLRLSRVRAALGVPHLLETRAGVASGSVVMGVLGTMMKREFTAIGHTTNLAARLQGAARPNEVVCARAVCDELPAGAELEQLELKGVGVIDAVRFKVSG